MQKTTKPNIDAKALANDYRMLPLCSTDTIALLRLYILKIEHKDSKEPVYKIVYGICTRSSEEKSRISSSQFTKLTQISNYNYSTAVVNIVDNFERVSGVINGLYQSKSLVSSLQETGAYNDEIYFDVPYNIESIIRPIVFNQTQSDSKYHKPILSPYYNVSCFSFSVCAIDKLQLFTLPDNTLVPEWTTLIKHILEWLKSKTNIDFISNESSRLGNIELINSPCVNKYEQPLVIINSQNQCQGLKITINQEAFSTDTKLLVNCVLSIDGQVVLNDCQEAYFIANTELDLTFYSVERYVKAEVSIWIFINGQYNVWYSNNVTFTQQIIIRMGMVGLQGRVSSDWLEGIRKNTKPLSSKVDELEKIERVSYTQSNVGRDNKAPWISATEQFRKIYNQLYPKQSEAEFFPQGWSKESKQHGALSFLEWFKRCANGTGRMVLQDPYFDSKALEFIARGTNTATEYIIVTQTQLVTNPDGTLKVDDKSDRHNRILQMISTHPTLFSSIRLKIYNVGGATNILHDRYMLLYDNNTPTKGFLLSNSIQGATTKQPLLITPIPYDTLLKVDDYISDSLKNKDISLVYDSESISQQVTNVKSKVCSPEFYNELKSKLSNKNDITTTRVNSLLSSNNIYFNQMFSTFGYFLANTNMSYNIIKCIDTQEIKYDFAKKLKDYIQKSPELKFPLGYIGSSDRYIYENYAYIFTADFNEVLKNASALDNIHETYGCGNYGVMYGSELLLEIDVPKFISLLINIHHKISKCEKQDIARTPLYRLANTVASTLLAHLSYGSNNLTTAVLLIQNKSEFVKSLGALYFLHALQNREIESLDIVKQNLPKDKFVSFCTIGLLEMRGVQNAPFSLLLNCLSDVFVNNYEESLFKVICEQVMLSYSDDLKLKFIPEFVNPLMSADIITADSALQIYLGVFSKVFSKRQRL